MTSFRVSQNSKPGVCLAALVLFALVALFPGQAVAQSQPTAAEARAFVEKAEKQLLELWIQYSRADWVNQNFITVDTDQLSAEANKNVLAATAQLAKEARRFDGMQLPEDITRRLKLLKLSVPAPAPPDPAEQKEIAELVASLQSDYGKGKYCPEGEKAKCLDINEITKIMEI